MIKILTQLIIKILSVKQMKNDNSDNKSVSLNNSVNSHLNIDLIYNDIMESKYISMSDFMVIVLLYFCVQFFIQFFIFNLKGLDYWMFEILFISLD